MKSLYVMIFLSTNAGGYEMEIFKYLSTPWGSLGEKGIIIKDTEENNLVVKYDDDNEEVFTIDIEEIKEILAEHIDVLDISEVEMPPVLDGSEDTFFFRIGNEENEVQMWNSWYWEENPEESPDEANEILEVFRAIADLLDEAYDIEIYL